MASNQVKVVLTPIANLSDTEIRTVIDSASPTDIASIYACNLTETNSNNSLVSVLFSVLYVNGGTKKLKCIATRISKNKNNFEMTTALDKHYFDCLAISANFVKDERFYLFNNQFLQITIMST